MAPQHPATAPSVSFGQAIRIGVGIDTSRYGHYAAFLRPDLQAAAGELQFAESAKGYAQLRHRLEHIAKQHQQVRFLVRLDAAGQYADNLLHFLHALATPGPDATASAPDLDRVSSTPLPSPLHLTISCGDPQRNKNYRAALFGGKKSDPVEARAAARYALAEKPAAVQALSLPFRLLRQVAGRLQATCRQRTRLINQFHHLMAIAFPELALLIKDIAVGWVLELVHRYPTAKLLAAATADDLAAIPYLPEKRIPKLLEHARSSICSLDGDTVEDLVRDQVGQLRDVNARQKHLENLLIQAYRNLPAANHVDSILGIGDVTASILTAYIVDIDRFDTPNHLVAYFGTLPIEIASGVDRLGQPRAAKRYVMSPRGNDLVRRYLWTAALSAIRFNPAVRPLYARVVAKHPDKKAIAVGHAMRKLLHLVFAIWKTGKPFDPNNYPWDKPAHVHCQAVSADAAGTPDEQHPPDTAGGQNNQAAGHKPVAEPAPKVVTAACPDSLLQALVVSDKTSIDFAHVKRQLTMARVLDHLGLLSRLRGSGAQRRSSCPIHRGDARGRTFSVNLQENVFQCFDSSCAKNGDVIDLWANVKAMSLRAAALDLVRTFNLEPTPIKHRTEKRNG